MLPTTFEEYLKESINEENKLQVLYKKVKAKVILDKKLTKEDEQIIENWKNRNYDIPDTF